MKLKIEADVVYDYVGVESNIRCVQVRLGSNIIAELEPVRQMQSFEYSYMSLEEIEREIINETVASYLAGLFSGK